MNENTLLKQFTQYLEDVKHIYPDDWQEKCPKTIHQYIPLIGQYTELDATEDENCQKLYQAAIDEMENALNLYLAPMCEEIEARIKFMKSEVGLEVG